MRRIPKSAAAGLSSHLVPLLLVFVLVLQQPGSRIGGVVAGEETLSRSSRRFRDPNATFYDLLGVSRHSSQKEIKRVFRKLAVQMHPDKLGPFENKEAEGEANAIFMKILKAYETLSDPILRQNYDLSGMKEETNAGPVMEESEVSYEDAPFGIFVRFGGGRGGFWFRSKGHGKRRAPDTVVALPLTFEEAFFGKTANVTVSRERLCQTCKGTGAAKPEEMTTVTMPPGVLPGHTVVLAGKGMEHPNKLPGSIRVVAVQLAHPRFERRGADLVHKKTISLMDALLGFERKLTLLDGKRVPIVHDQVNLSGYTQEFPNLGFPAAGDGLTSKRGSLIVELEVKFPPRLREAHLAALRVVLTEKEIEILEDVLKLMSARKGKYQWPGMGPEEYRYTHFCGTEGDGHDSFDDASQPRCIPDLLWWARPPPPAVAANADR
eukprot:g12328.t1